MRKIGIGARAYRFDAARRLVARSGISGRGLVIAAPMLWLGLFFLVPFLVVAKISLSEAAWAQPPYTPLLAWLENDVLEITLNFGNYLFLLSDSLYVAAYAESVRIAAVSTLACLILGYPMAYAIARARQPTQTVLLMLIVLPFWTSFLLRVYAWIGFLNRDGLINQILMGTGVISEPLVLLQTDFAVYLGITYSYLPFMILPLYANLVKLDGDLLEAAADLGARPISTFLTVTLPLSLPGILAGSMLVFVPAIGEFVIPALLGGPQTLMIGRVLWDEFFANRDWPLASALAIVTLVILLIPLMLARLIGREEEQR